MQTFERRLMNIVFIAGAILFLGAMTADYVVTNSFIPHPATANAASGETVPYNVKGKTVYITQTEQNEATAIFFGKVSGLFLLLVYGVRFVARQ